jgi:trigger factor
MAEHEHVHGHSTEFGAVPQLSHDHGHEHAPGHAHEHEHGHEHEHEAPEKGEQKVTVEDVGPARKCLTIEVPAERIAKKIESGYTRLRDEAILPGFRRGRAPQRLIEKRFGDSIRDDTRTQLLTECYEQAIEELKLQVLGEPQVKDLETLKLPAEGPLVYKVEVEVPPTFELPELTGIEVKRPVTVVNDQAIEAEVESLRERLGTQADVTDAVVQEGDVLICDVRVLQGTNASPVAGGDDELLHLPEAPVWVSGASQNYRGVIAGLIVEDAGRQLAGKRVGEALSVSLTGPTNHENEKVRNQPVTVIVRIDKVQRLEPAPLDTLPARLGVENQQQLRQSLAQMLEQRGRIEQKNDMHRQVTDYLMQKVPMELPAGISGRQTERVLQRQAMELAYRGVPQEKIEEKIAESRAASEEQARTQLKLFFLLDQAAKKLAIEVSEAEVNGAITVLATQQGRRPEKLRQQMARNGQIEQVYLQVRENKTLDKILESAKVVDASADSPAAPAAEPVKPADPKA